MRGSRRSAGDEGMALLAVLAGMLALSLVVMATMAYVVNSQPVTRATQDATAAVQAAQAGVDDYLARLTSCDSYWKAPCTGSVPNQALTGWASVPSTDARADPAEYHVEVLQNPDTVPGLVRLHSTGRIQGRTGVKRSLVVDLRKKSFLDYIYYTDKESSSPLTLVKRFPARNNVIDPPVQGWNAIRYLGMSAAEAGKCGRYWYATSTSTARDTAQQPSERVQLSSNRGATWQDYTVSGQSCEIQFASIDTINGPAHSNDALRINGALFKDRITTSWLRGSTPDPNRVAQYEGSGPHPDGRSPVEAPRVELPPSNAAIRDRTDPAKGGQDGCIYTGPTRLVLRDGRMEVTSPGTRVTNPGCGSAGATGISRQLVDLPKNGVVYVQRSSQACSAHPLGFPIAGDLTRYDCAAGDAFVQGQLGGRLTVATFNDVTVTEDLTYRNGPSGGDSLGLIANDFVQVYHPVRCSVPVPSGFACKDGDTADIDVGLRDITINAAILSVKQSFTVQNYDKGNRLGTLRVLGGIYQAYRGPVGTGGGSGGGTGYAKQYDFDNRLRSLPPPSFLDPAAAPWEFDGSAEVKTPTGLPTGAAP